MMAPQDDESGPSRKWRWFKKSEKEVKKSCMQQSGEQEQKELKVNSFMEDLFQDPIEEASSENLQYSGIDHEYARSLCESLLDDLLSKIMDSKDFVGEGESNQSKLFKLLTNMKDKVMRQDASAEGSVGKVDCQGCGTEQVHECEDEGEETMTKEEKVENKEMTNLIGKLRAMDTHDVEMTSGRWGEHNQPDIGNEEFSQTKGVEDQTVHDAESAGIQEFISINMNKEECEKDISGEGKQVILDIIEEMLDKVIDQGLINSQGGEGKEEKMSKEERVKKYLEFVRLWLETYKAGEESERRREANVVWKKKIEDGQSVSEVGYLEQVAILRAIRRKQEFGDGPFRTFGPTEVEFTCYGAEQSVQVAGSFNGWKPEELKQKEDGEWAANLKIGPGTHLYKYVVDGEWLVDPTKQMTTDSKGNTNNVVMVEDNRVTKCQKEIQEEREKLMKTLQAAWSPSGLGLNLCPVKATKHA